MYRLALLAAFLLIPATACAQGMEEMGDAAEAAVTAGAIAPNRANTESRVSPNALASQTFGITTATVQYGRPSVRGREVFGALVPYDEVWRAGANEATTLTVSTDVMVEGQPLAAGTYALFMVPMDGDTWTVVLNEAAQQWGAYEYDMEKDVARVDVIAETDRPVQEQLLMLFEQVDAEGTTLVLAWDDVRIPVRITL